MRVIPEGLVYDPADLGLDNVAVAAAGGIVAGLTVPWIAVFPRTRFALVVEDESNLGATPCNVLQISFDFDAAAFVSGSNSSIWAAFTNNPRTQHYYASGFSPSAAVVTTGTGLGVEIGKALSAPYIRFSLQNNHATIVATLSLRAFAYR